MLYNKLMNKKHILAKNLRKNSTIQERRIWNILKNRQFHNLKFKRQQPIGNYIVDFACQEKRLIIEIDGSQHNFPNNLEYDQKRTQYLEKLGYTVIRFWNNEVFENIEGIVMALEKYL